MAHFTAKSLGAFLESTKSLFEGEARSVMMDDKPLILRIVIVWQFASDEDHCRVGRKLITVFVLTVPYAV